MFLKHKVFKVIFLICFVFSISSQINPVSVGASGGSGTEADPYLISTVQQLININDDVGAHYRLVNDIDLGVAPYNTGMGWEPLAQFSGSFDGNGYTIHNLFIHRPDYENGVGLFSELYDANVSNLTLSNVNILGNYHVGSVAGLTFFGTLDRVLVSGNVSGNNAIGGILGKNLGGSILKVVFNGHVQGNLNGTLSSSESSFTGGIVGDNTDYENSSGSVQEAYAFGSVQAQSSFGGIAGRNEATLSDVYALQDYLKFNENMLSTDNFGRIAPSSELGEVLRAFASPVTLAPSGYSFDDSDINNGTTLSAGDLDEVVRDEIANLIPSGIMRSDLETILDAQKSFLLAPTFISTNTAMHVTDNITLPTVGFGQTSIQWQSSDPSVVDHTGVVTRPTNNDNRLLILTSTVTANVYSGVVQYSNHHYVMVLRAGPLLESAYMNDSGDQIIAVFQQDISNVDVNKIIVTADGTNATISDYHLESNQLILNMDAPLSNSLVVSLELQAGAVVDSNDEPNRPASLSIDIPYPDIFFERDHILEVLEITDSNVRISIQHLLKYMGQVGVIDTLNPAHKMEYVRNLLTLVDSNYVDSERPR